MSFSERLRLLIAERSVSDFARRVNLSESLIRKYLKGSEPSLSRAHEIASVCQCSLTWLASGEGQPFDATSTVDSDAMQAALRIIAEQSGQTDASLPDTDRLERIIALYQYLRNNRLRDNTLDEHLGQSFARFLKQEEKLPASKKSLPG